jgi:hypothetical protein
MVECHWTIWLYAPEVIELLLSRTETRDGRPCHVSGLHIAALTIRGARHALISHLVVGSCAGKCESTVDALFKHGCDCRDICHEYASQQAMSFTALSIMLSTSTEQFPDSHVILVGESLGWSDHSRPNFMRQLDKRTCSQQKSTAMVINSTGVFFMTLNHIVVE